VRTLTAAARGAEGDAPQQFHILGGIVVLAAVRACERSVSEAENGAERSDERDKSAVQNRLHLRLITINSYNRFLKLL